MNGSRLSRPQVPRIRQQPKRHPCQEMRVWVRVEIWRPQLACRGRDARGSLGVSHILGTVSEGTTAGRAKPSGLRPNAQRAECTSHAVPVQDLLLAGIRNIMDVDISYEVLRAHGFAGAV
jgi:hypothetical protein